MSDRTDTPRDYEPAAIEARARAREESGFWESPLDQAWERINALGGSIRVPNDYEQGYVHAVEQALLIIEELGGSDPLPKRAARA